MKAISNNTVKDILELRETFDSSNELHFEAAAELIFRLADEIKNSNEVYYKLVQWPESQMLMEHPRFHECLFVDNIEGHDDVGSSAYMCPVDLYEEIFITINNY